MARKFLYLVAIIIALFVAGRIAWEMFSRDLAELAFVPSAEFVEQSELAESAYESPEMWHSRPGIGTSDPARWQPALRIETDGATSQDADGGSTAKSSTNARPVNPDSANVAKFAVFFVHPTSFMDRSAWNAKIGNQDAENLARTYIRGLASPFNSATEIWAPKYRQATMGAFLTDEENGKKAIDAAYSDVLAAYRYFLDSIDDDMPIVLVGHSQGALHVMNLLRRDIAASKDADRLAAAYIIGWPISVDHDLPQIGFDACATPRQTGCIMSWSSFAEPADPSDVIDTYSNSIGLDGKMRGDSTILCTNPITGTFGGAAEARRNLGTLVPNDDITTGELVAGAVPARCDQRGLLLIGDPPELGSYVLPGNNYHVYDIPLFWANTKADVARRVNAWAQAR